MVALVTVIHCGRLIDGVGDTPIENKSIVILDDRITAILDHSSPLIPKNAKEIDLRGYTVLPGLFDAHCHPCIFMELDFQINHLHHSSAYKALKGMRTVQDMLRCGWTSLRVPGDADVFYAVLDIKKAIQDGVYVGPRIQAAAHYLSTTGGVGDLNFLSCDFSCCAPDGKIVNGSDQIRKVVREEIKYGSDWIKILVTGTQISDRCSPTVYFTQEEILAAVDEATRLGKPVSAHAHATEGIKAAIQAGVRSIEHGSFIDEEGIKMMIEHDIFLIPTLFIGKYYCEIPKKESISEKWRQQHKIVYEHSLECIGNAVKAGVKIATGTDYIGWSPMELNAGELASLVSVGMTEMQAIKAATVEGAKLFGWEKDLGTLEVGKVADIIAVQGNPLADISEMQRVKFVMLAGKVLRDDFKGISHFGLLDTGK